MIWTLLCIAADVNVKKVTHVSGKDNANYDRLACREGVTTVSVEDEAAEMGVVGGAVLEVNGDESVMAILRLCDTRTEFLSELEFIDFWIRALQTISLVSTSPPTLLQHINTPLHRTVINRTLRPLSISPPDFTSSCRLRWRTT
jgi:hypothetical protein